MNTAHALAPEATIVVIGAGRLGRVLARALGTAGFDVRGPIGRDTEIPDADVALLCVPDAAIPQAAINARGHASLVGHVSGATPLDDVDFSIHPLQTFTGTESPDIFHSIGAAVAGSTDEARAVAAQLARALGARPFAVDDAHRATYHAAASFASNFVLAVLDAAAQLASASGIPQQEARDLLAPLVRRTVDNWDADGAARALTGPIARGDETTVARQRAAIDEVALHLRGLFDELTSATRAVTARTDEETL
ncbi:MULTISPECIES: DUF2520 domain-containing protein [unclassified Microbacterium]|uniref:DUF2520 domain-containing protein n=1 Tax=unclassified Microbacterium TaxID=2609290 RepID=UPI000EA97654|nr:MULTISPECIES: DUF2520 domain-containing protein [unclassified Microbacterium]MBT2484300.1 DUF2520 domain-containing protein [Microbacterium sp. ISL-108]RKN67219.1 DUF2520 domain-containing protein [Microbacterium sp. CGR2]